MNGKRQFFELAVLQKECNREFDLRGNVASLTMNGILFCTSRKLVKLQNSVLCSVSESELDLDSMGVVHQIQIWNPDRNLGRPNPSL